MSESNEFLFSLHQFILSVLGLFFLYFAWKDQASGTYEPLKRISAITLASTFAGIFLGLFFYLLNEWGATSLFISLTLALVITLSLFDPKFAVSLFIFMLISRPWEFFKSPLMLSMPRDIFILCLLSFLGQKIIRRQYYFQWNFASTLMFLYASWTFFSLIPSHNAVSAMIEFNDVFIKGIIVYFLIVNVIDKKDYVLPVQSALVLGVSEKAIMAFYKSQVLKEVADGERLTSVGILENSNDIAAIMILAIPFTLSFFKNIGSTFLRYSISVVFLSFYFFLVWESKSRGAVLAIGMLIVAWLWLKAQNKKIATTIVLFGMLASVFAINSIDRKAEDIEGSTSNRKVYWGAAVNMAIRNPVFGIGYHNYPLRLLEFTNGHVGTEGKHKTAHSTWLLALAESGFIGFFFYIGIWLFTLRSSWKMKESHPEFFLALISYGTAISFLSHTYMLYPYILLGLTSAAGQFYARENSCFSVNEIRYGLLTREYS